MMPTVRQRKRAVIEGRILEEVRRYHSTFNRGMAMNILSAKYARALGWLGEFPEVILEMERAGLLRIEVKPSGARVVLPAVIVAKLSDASKWF